MCPGEKLVAFTMCDLPNTWPCFSASFAARLSSPLLELVHRFFRTPARLLFRRLFTPFFTLPVTIFSNRKNIFCTKNVVPVRNWWICPRALSTILVHVFPHLLLLGFFSPLSQFVHHFSTPLLDFCFITFSHPFHPPRHRFFTPQ